MPTELEELVGFLASPRQDIRQIACEHLVGYSAGQSNSIFKPPGLKPVKDLKLLVRDKLPISHNALKILVNLTDDPAVLNVVATDDTFFELLLALIVNPTYPYSDLIAMLLANMAKHDSIPEKVVKLKREKPKEEWKVSNSEMAMDQLMDVFVKGSGKTLNEDADFDYLAYFFADVARHPKGRKHWVERQPYDDVIPLTKLIVFTEHKSLIRRKGVASTIKNALFDIDSHEVLISESSVNLLPYLLLPLMGSEEFPEDEMLEMPAEVQLLPPDKQRETDNSIISSHLESIMLLTTTRPVRERIREVQVYPIIRELHLQVDDEGVRDVCERIVDVLHADEDEQTQNDDSAIEEKRETVKEVAEDDDDIVDLV